MKRYVHTSRVANAYQQALRAPERAFAILHVLLIDSLSPEQLEVYDLACAQSSLTTADVMERFGMENNHASGLLRELADYGLLARERKSDARGRFFEYKIKRVNSG